MQLNLIKEKYIKFREGRDYYLENISFEPSQDFKFELSTFELSLGRRQGHTTFISENAKITDLIIFPNFAMLQHFTKTSIFNKRFKYITFIDDFLRDKSRGLALDKKSCIWIDEYSMIKSNKETQLNTKLFEYFNRHNIDLIIKLG